MTIRRFDFITGPETDTLPGNEVIQSSGVLVTALGYTVLDDDGYGLIVCTDSITIALPTASDNANRAITILNDRDAISTTNHVTVTAEGSDTIQGAASYNVCEYNGAATFWCDGSDWYVINKNKVRDFDRDYLQVKSVGDIGFQHWAGNQHVADILGTGTDIAYYRMLSTDIVNDSSGSYDLTNNGVSTTAGINGSDYAGRFDGVNDRMTQATLLDVMPSALNISFWFKSNDGNPSAIGYIFNKDNVTNEDNISCIMNTSGQIVVAFEEGNNGSTLLYSTTTLPNGATDWYHVTIGWDTTYGVRLWVNGVLEAADPTATTLMGNGTDNDFYLGNIHSLGSPWEGTLACFRVGNTVLKQRDVDLLYATAYSLPDFPYTAPFTVKSFIKPDNDDDYLRELDFVEVARTDNYVYRQGFTDSSGIQSTDYIRVIIEE